jgi:hypothetical protein
MMMDVDADSYGQKRSMEVVEGPALNQIGQRAEMPSRLLMESGQVKGEIIPQARRGMTKQQPAGGSHIAVTVKAMKSCAPAIDRLVSQSDRSAGCFKKLSGCSFDGGIRGKHFSPVWVHSRSCTVAHISLGGRSC